MDIRSRSSRDPDGVVDDMLATDDATLPRCHACGTVLRDTPDGHACGGCGHAIRSAPTRTIHATHLPDVRTARYGVGHGTERGGGEPMAHQLDDVTASIRTTRNSVTTTERERATSVYNVVREVYDSVKFDVHGPGA